jgi:hypothetical protein
MSEQIPIKYLGFWDVPRNFIVRYRGNTLLFDSAFDETLDDYWDFYKVYVLPPIRDDELPKDWTILPARATGYLGEVPIAQVQFDPSRRESIDSAVLDEMMTHQSTG